MLNTFNCPWIKVEVQGKLENILNRKVIKMTHQNWWNISIAMYRKCIVLNATQKITMAKDKLIIFFQEVSRRIVN